MGVGEALLLGLVQGFTEFLPVSSSGHLVLAKAALGVETGDIVVEVALHFATALAVVTVLWARLREIIIQAGSATGGLVSRRRSRGQWLADPAVRYVLLLAGATVPAVVVGLLLESSAESLFSLPRVASYMLLITGLVLWATRLIPADRKEMGVVAAAFVGIAQAVAILPGISRSGITISAALYRGVADRRAAEFSFLLALPAILGASLLKVPAAWQAMAGGGEGFGLRELSLGMVVAYVAGCAAIRLVFGSLRRRVFPFFACYCWVVGLSGLILMR